VNPESEACASIELLSLWIFLALKDQVNTLEVEFFQTKKFIFNLI